jgi:hypothetical protein
VQLLGTTTIQRFSGLVSELPSHERLYSLRVEDSMRHSSKVLVIVVAVVASGVLPIRVLGAQDKPADSGRLAVSVRYTGRGEVDQDHRIWIWLFDTPDITPDSNPLAIGQLSDNGGTYKYTGLPKEVYVAMAYDEKGGYDGTTGPPPQGTPVVIYGAASGSGAAAVKTGGDEAKLETSFDDSVRMP